MCGILAYISKEKIKDSAIFNLKNLMVCRGPDNQSYSRFKFGDQFLHLFHSRLSIQDLNKRSNQPFRFNNYVIIFNGEIYNFKNLRNKLKKTKFKTLSDTEIILHYYHNFKEKCFSMFEGMWSIIIYDTQKNKLIISRDRFGEKPILIYRFNNEIIISSQISYIRELKKKEIFNFNDNKINSFLHYGYKSLFKNNETFFKKIRFFEKGTISTIDSNLKITKNKYWSLKISKEIQKLNIEDHIENSKRLLIDSINLRLISDVPVALNLSGGIDSGAICSIASKILEQKIETFSIIDRDKRYNEKISILKTAKDCNVNTNFIKLKKNINFFKILENSIEYNNYPVFTITNLIQYYLSSFIKKKGYKVVLSGSGADEIYGGYYDHYLMMLNELRKQKSQKYHDYLNLWRKNIKKNLRNPFFKKENLFFKNENFREYIYDNFKNNRAYCLKKLSNDFTEKNFFNNLLKNRMANELFHENVPIFMHSEDLNSMQFSIENRSPFLDTKLIEYLFSVKSEHLLDKSQNKFVLRSSLKGILNDNVLNQKMKSGFNASIISLFDFDNIEIKRFINKDSLIYEFVNKKKMINLIKNKKLIEKNSYSKFLFTFLSLKCFLDRFGS